MRSCVAENPVSKVASVRPARCAPIPNLTVSLDAQESTPHQENFLLRHQVGPSVLGIVIAIGRSASDSLTPKKEACIIVWCHHHCRGLKKTSEKSEDHKWLKIFASAQSASFCIQEIPSDAAISLKRLASRSRIVENEHSLCVFIGRYWCWQNDFRRLKHRFLKSYHPVFMTIPTSNWSELYTLKARGLGSALYAYTVNNTSKPPKNEQLCTNYSCN